MEELKSMPISEEEQMEMDFMKMNPTKRTTKKRKKEYEEEDDDDQPCSSSKIWKEMAERLEEEQMNEDTYDEEEDDQPGTSSKIWKEVAERKMKEEEKEEEEDEEEKDPMAYVATSEYLKKIEGMTKRNEQLLKNIYEKGEEQGESEEEMDEKLAAVKNSSKGNRKITYLIKMIKLNELTNEIITSCVRANKDIHGMKKSQCTELDKQLFELNKLDEINSKIIAIKDRELAHHERIKDIHRDKKDAQTRLIAILERRVEQLKAMLEQAEIEAARRGREVLPHRQLNRQIKRYLGGLREVLERAHNIYPNPVTERMIEMAQEDFDLEEERRQIRREELLENLADERERIE
ncbi:hypothetical protein PFISCL1PPCAC_27233 [Pristionchus fissidentatus]|uniref:Uncharacterized protein n=1 Tax=Pristionchus fissidentatus TaxID=1538716 RepID=A0AAV5WV80_9BILA|nr:hypothetical protein PFISCL1PPCAC_27233 [Pristionchus fissidentatus]